MSTGRIRAAGVSARPRCRPSLTHFPWRRRNSWRHNDRRQSRRLRQPIPPVNQVLSRPPANGRWNGLFAWDEGCGGQACRENRSSRPMLQNRPPCAPCRNRSSAAKWTGRGRSPACAGAGSADAGRAARRGDRRGSRDASIHGPPPKRKTKTWRLQQITVVCSHPFGLASRRLWPQVLMIIRRSVPYHVSGLCVRCTQRVGRSSVRPDLPSTSVLPSHSPRDGSAYAASALLVG
jgi:hypothetical protein